MKSFYGISGRFFFCPFTPLSGMWLCSEIVASKSGVYLSALNMKPPCIVAKI